MYSIHLAIVTFTGAGVINTDFPNLFFQLNLPLKGQLG